MIVVDEGRSEPDCRTSSSQYGGHVGGRPGVGLIKLSYSDDKVLSVLSSNLNSQVLNDEWTCSRAS